MLWKLDERFKPSCISCQWRGRIGQFIVNTSDKWWEISNQEQVIKASDEIIALLKEKALFHLSSFKTTQDVIRQLSKFQISNLLELLDESTDLNEAERRECKTLLVHD